MKTPSDKDRDSKHTYADCPKAQFNMLDSGWKTLMGFAKTKHGNVWSIDLKECSLTWDTHTQDVLQTDIGMVLCFGRFMCYVGHEED